MSNSENDWNRQVSWCFDRTLLFLTFRFSAEFEKGHMFEHEPHCPLFRVKQNSTIDDRSAVKEKKFLSFQTNRTETNFQKFLRIPGPLNAKDLVDKYFDG